MLRWAQAAEATYVRCNIPKLAQANGILETEKDLSANVQKGPGWLEAGPSSFGSRLLCGDTVTLAVQR